MKVTATSWPRKTVESIDCRKKDIIIRIADWTRDKDEPAYDVDCYVRGVYDWTLSGTFCTKNANQTKAQARTAAIAFAQEQIGKLVR